MRRFDNQRTVDPDGNPSDVDWGHNEVHSRASDTTGKSHTPLGDPTRWGAQVSVQVAAVGLFTSPQFLRVQAKDLYAREWGLIGTVAADISLFDAAQLLLGQAIVVPGWIPLLNLQMGAGQNTITHRIKLAAAIALAAPFYAFELAGDVVTAPFVISGGLIGQALAVSVSHALNVAGPFSTTDKITTSAQLAPFAAGTGL